MKTLVFGASAGLGRAVAEVLGAQGHCLLLVGGDAMDLDATASDIRLRFGTEVQTCPCRVGSEPWMDKVAALLRSSGPPEALLFPIGAASDEDRGMLDLESAQRILEINFLAVAATVSSVLPAMLARGSGVIAGFGSVASARGRGRNVVYSAAKRALESYFESLRHLTAESGVRVQYFHLGYLDTEGNVGRRLLFPPARPDRVARRIVHRLQGRGGVFYLPSYWRWVVMLLRLVPWPIYRRLSF